MEYEATDRKYETNDQGSAMVSFDIAAAYPKEAGIKKWVRTVTLDRMRDMVVIAEEFDLERSVPVVVFDDDAEQLLRSRAAVSR